jgi:ketosteroid isomerase-like protein
LEETTMTTEEEVCAAAKRFYDGIEQMISGGGIGIIKETWAHNDRVTAGHPNGEWSQGWDEIVPTWEIFAGLGRADRAGTKMRDMKAHVYGDVAYTTCLFTTSPAFGAETLACTNVLHREGGVWKIVHHHADKAPGLGAAAEKFARGG